ncbi:hypothetical protein G6F65_015598 [Rhizopus arrhizus]|nr:hypothetical protein G6F65_015598 [Rhizopus arrhizus]
MAGPCASSAGLATGNSTGVISLKVDKPGHRADGQRALDRIGLQQRQRFFDLIKGAQQARIGAGARRREPHPMPFAHEQRPPQTVFQQTDLLAAGAGGDSQGLGRRFQAAQARGLGKGSQGKQRQYGTHNAFL